MFREKKKSEEDAKNYKCLTSSTATAFWPFALTFASLQNPTFTPACGMKLQALFPVGEAHLCGQVLWKSLTINNKL